MKYCITISFMDHSKRNKEMKRNAPVTRSPTLITNSSGNTGLKICLTFLIVPPPAVTTAPLDAVVATLAILNLLELTLRKEFLAPARKEEILDRRPSSPPPMGGGGARPPPPIKGAKGRGRVPSSV